MVNCFLLGWVGGKPVMRPYLEVGMFFTVIYFSYFWFVQPIIRIIEDNFWTNELYLTKMVDSPAMSNLKRLYNV